ncbi:DUF5611 family protein [Methanogenium marinum]|uniref:DUF5611 family protein n=1 Tax=Methanogenium marinum TaxID=348610 RepID=A0A9Q4KUE1_9EURY|nr:DUF5611 family protein [Methanogenium marinum]MDE4909076.1 DUF5611 family protein [Methanogenium marinum]
MQEYPIKRGYTKEFATRMVDGLTELFGETAEENEGHYLIIYGSFKRFEVYTGEKGKTLIVDSDSDMSIFDRFTEEEANGIVLDTNRRFRQYLEFVTGYNTKERKKNAEKAAKKSA